MALFMKGDEPEMSRQNIIGRNKEIQRLDRVVKEEQAQLVVVYGRRRVGKTYLIHQYFSGRFDFLFTGVHNQPKEIQLRSFITELNRQARTDHTAPSNWFDAFELLRSYLESLPVQDSRVVFFDEMPWMDTQKSDFLPAFEWFWNSWAAMQSHLVFIICGSATSWMVDHIDQNRGGLFNRQTCRLYLEPFSLYETEQYLRSRGFNWTRASIAECYMILGGIPYYLRAMDPQMTLNANIDNLLFRKRAELWDEFDHLYDTLFSNSQAYIKIVDALSRKRNGLSREEIIRKTRLPGNGELSRMLKNLCDAGFVRASVNYFNRKEILYQLADYYTLFYFRFIQSAYGKDEHYWSNSTDLPARRAWMGLTFEQICRDHIPQIKRRLEIGGVLSEEFSCRIPSEASESSADTARGAQNDLLIDRRDQVIDLCEIKFSINEFEIDRNYDQALRNKIAALQKETGFRKDIRLIMITTYGVRQNKYSNLVNAEVTLDDLFLP